MEMETEGQSEISSIWKFLSTNSLLNTDIDSVIGKATMLFLQFNAMSNRCNRIEEAIHKQQKLLENIIHQLRLIHQLRKLK